MKKSHLLLLPLAAVLVAWFFLLRPESLGGPAGYVMVAGHSMEPTLRTGDLALTQKQGSYDTGDIVAFHVPKGEPAEGAMIIHRIVGGSAAEGYLVQGDNKNAPDPWRPKPQNIVGRLRFTLPGAARWVWLLRQPLILGSVVGGLGMLTVLSGGSGKPASRRGTSQSRPAGTARGDSPRTRLILGLVVAGALTRVVALLRKRGRGRLS